MVPPSLDDQTDIESQSECHWDGAHLDGAIGFQTFEHVSVVNDGRVALVVHQVISAKYREILILVSVFSLLIDHLVSY